MVLPEQFNEAEAKFPLPNFAYWYFYKFPSRQYIIAGAIVVMIGVVFTGFDLSRVFRAIPTYIVAGMLLLITPVAVTAAIQKRITYRKRAKYLKITYREYINYLNVHSNEPNSSI